MFKKKQSIPLSDLVTALRICRSLHEEAKIERNTYDYTLASFISDRNYSIRQIEEKIAAYGYRKIGEEFYLVSDLNRMPSIQLNDYEKHDEVLYDKKVLSALTPLKI